MNPRILWLSFILIATASAATPPVITGASPDPIDAGGQAFLLTITGTGYDTGSIARLSGTSLSTTFVSATELRGEITPALRAVSGGPILTVVNADGTASNGRQIHISPVLLAIGPIAAVAGGPAVTVTVTGIGLTAKDVLLWSVPGKQTVLFPTFVDSTKLIAVIPANLLSTAQSASIQIVEALLDLASAALPFEVLVAPTVASLSPNPVDAGGDYFRVTVTGTGFVRNSLVNWAGTPLYTFYVNSTQLQAAITADLRALSGTFPLTVTDPGVSTSTVASFTVSPVLFTVSPALAGGGGPAVPITATGVGFTRNDVLIFSGTALATAYVSSTMLTAVIPAALLRTSGTATVQVSDSTGAGRSLPQLFPIVAAPVISTIAPTSATAGSPAFTLTVTGANCPAGCVVQWNGSPLTTSRAADTTVTASVPANLIASAGAANIQLANQNGGGASNTAAFTINPAAALLNSLSPSAVTAGSAAFPLTVNGTGFVAGSIVLWNGSRLSTSYLGGTQLTAFVTADLVSVRAGIGASVTVLNPGGAVSNSLTFSMDPARPAILSLTPASAGAGATALGIAIAGTNFASNCVVRWDGAAVETTFADAGHVAASVPASLMMNAGAIAITVTNPSGLVANAMTFTLIPSTPAAAAVIPASVTEGVPAFTLAVNGAYFAPAATVLWNGAALATTFVRTAQLTAVVPAKLVAAAGNASITVSNPGGLVSQAIGFVVAAAPPAAPPPPAVTSAGVVNAFSSLPSVAPGTLISIYGTLLAPEDGRAEAMPLPNSLNGTSVSINGTPAPLLFVSATQINAQAPFETPIGTAVLVVRHGALESVPVKIDVRAVAPGIAALPGGSHAVAVNYPGGALNGPRDPVHPGEYVVVYLTGQGLVDHPVANGAESPGEPLSLPLAKVRAKLGNQTAEVAFAGLAPGFVGLLQVNLLIPDVPEGEQALEVTVGGVAANPTVLSVAAKR